MTWPGFLSMGGYAVFVWCSYALVLAAMGGEVLLLLRRRKSGHEGTTTFRDSRQVNP
jgi:heme exporter protein CcmD